MNLFELYLAASCAVMFLSFLRVLILGGDLKFTDMLLIGFMVGVPLTGAVYFVEEILKRF